MKNYGVVSKAQAKRIVARGAKLLDKRIPGWAKLIDVPALKLNNANLCVLGQVFTKKIRDMLSTSLATRDIKIDNAFVAAKNFLFPSDTYAGSVTESEKYGFNLSDKLRSPENWERLATAWVVEIKRRAK